MAATSSAIASGKRDHGEPPEHPGDDVDGEADDQRPPGPGRRQVDTPRNLSAREVRRTGGDRRRFGSALGAEGAPTGGRSARRGALPPRPAAGAASAEPATRVRGLLLRHARPGAGATSLVVGVHGHRLPSLCEAHHQPVGRRRVRSGEESRGGEDVVVIDDHAGSPAAAATRPRSRRCCRPARGPRRRPGRCAGRLAGADEQVHLAQVLAGPLDHPTVRARRPPGTVRRAAATPGRPLLRRSPRRCRAPCRCRAAGRDRPDGRGPHRSGRARPPRRSRAPTSACRGLPRRCG